MSEKIVSSICCFSGISFRFDWIVPSFALKEQRYGYLSYKYGVLLSSELESRILQQGR